MFLGHDCNACFEAKKKIRIRHSLCHDFHSSLMETLSVYRFFLFLSALVGATNTAFGGGQRGGKCVGRVVGSGRGAQRPLIQRQLEQPGRRAVGARPRRLQVHKLPDRILAGPAEAPLQVCIAANKRAGCLLLMCVCCVVVTESDSVVVVVS